MADIFISYSKRHAQLTVDLARDLEAKGYTTWWDTGLLPDDTFFPQTIRAEIEKSQAVIVIWSQHAIESEWVYSEARLGRELDKLLQVRDSALNPNSIPLPFTAGNIPSVSDREKIFIALARKRITPSNKITPGSTQETGSKKANLEAANEVKENLAGSNFSGFFEKRGQCGNIDSVGSFSATFSELRADLSAFFSDLSAFFSELLTFFSDPFGKRDQDSKGSMRGIDYVYTLQIDFFEAKNGAKKRVQFPDDNKVLDITIPAGISSGRRLRLRGKGGPGVNGGQQGDAFIEIKVLPAPNS